MANQKISNSTYQWSPSGASLIPIVEWGVNKNTTIDDLPVPSGLSTDAVSEGSNLYYTEWRVSANTDVTANTAKNTYPSADETKLSGIEAGAEVNVTSGLTLTTTSVNGVTPTTWGAATNFLNEAGWYTIPAGWGGGDASEVVISVTYGEAITAWNALAYNIGFTETIDSHDTTATASSNVWGIWTTSVKKSGQSFTTVQQEYIDDFKV